MPKCQCCSDYEINYQIHDAEIGDVRLCRRCFQRMDGALTLQRATIEKHHLDEVYQRHKDSIEKVKAEIRKDQDAQFQRMWEMDGSHIKEGAIR